VLHLLAPEALLHPVDAQPEQSPVLQVFVKGKVLLVQQVVALQVAHFALKRITLECSVSTRRIRLESK
jgi:hypothetical protein